MAGILPKVTELVSGSPRDLSANRALHCSAAATNSPQVVVTYAGSVSWSWQRARVWNQTVLGSNCGPAHLVAPEPLE